jgi:hypothetical protein
MPEVAVNEHGDLFPLKNNIRPAAHALWALQEPEAKISKQA